MPGTRVFIQEKQLGSLADSAGNYQFTGLRPDVYTVEYRYIGYHTAVVRVQLPADSRRSVMLTSENINLKEVQGSGTK